MKGDWVRGDWGFITQQLTGNELTDLSVVVKFAHLALFHLYVDNPEHLMPTTEDLVSWNRLNDAVETERKRRHDEGRDSENPAGGTGENPAE